MAEASITSELPFFTTIFDTFELFQDSDIPIPGFSAVPISWVGSVEVIVPVVVEITAL